uniref:RNA-directed DNA polymerase n=1 Tax=Tanacetum cinerariifolium TaxID=118510 RepID=A0A6L2LXL0_TANCI|nr:reverse transcriptase domain-containing protein [Tanacetum cinerariifolium]
MRTRSQSRSNFLQQEASPVIVEPLRIEFPFLEDQSLENPPPEVPMADNRTMAKLLQAPTEGYEDAIVILEITAYNFELMHDLINLVQNKFDESFYEACEHFNDLLRACPHHGFSEMHQLDTFYNALNINDQDSLNSAVGGNFLEKMPRECLKIIESKSKVNQALVYQAHIPQTQRVSQIDFESYVKANDAILRNMQSQGQSTQNQCQNIQNQNQNQQIQMAALMEMMSKLVNSNTASSSGSGTLPGNTITILKEDLKGITTRSGVAYQGPKTPSPSKQGTKVTKDQVQAPSSQDTAPVQPSVIQFESQVLVSEPVEQIEKFYEIFKDMSFEISFTDALTVMPKFALTLKALIGNKEKLNEMARTPMNEHCSAVILNQLPRKLGDPIKFLIPCEFPGMDECLALADLGASINLMPFFVWEALSLPKLTSTSMTLKLAERSVSKPIGIAKDVSFKTGRALIDVHKGELTLRIGKEAITYNLDLTVSPTPDEDLIVSTTSPTLTLFGDSDFLLFQEADAFLAKTVKSSIDEPPEIELKDLPPHLEYAFLEGDNKLPVIIAKELGDEEKFALIKRRVNPKIHDVIKKEDEKLLDAVLINPISDSPWVSPTMEVFMVDFSVFRNSFENCLSRLDKMLQRCEDTNLSLNWEKSHFMVKEGIVLGHKISKNGIEVDKAKIDVIAKLPHPTTVKGAVLGQRHEKHFKPIHYASKMMNDAKTNYTTTEKVMLAVVYAFEKFRSYLIMNKSIVHTDHSALKYLFAKKDAKARLLRWVLLLQKFDFQVLDTKGAENLAADHLCRLENPYKNVLDPKEINESFPLETLSMVTFRGDSSAS